MTATGTDPSSAPGAPDPEPTTFDADYVKKLRDEAAKYRNEAKTNAEAARKLAELEESQKTETQKLSDAKTAAEKDAADAKAEALRWRIAARHSITDEDAELFLTGTDEDTLTKQAQRLTAREGEHKKKPNVVPKEGTSTSKPGDDPVRTLVRGLFKPGDE